MFRKCCVKKIWCGPNQNKFDNPGLTVNEFLQHTVTTTHYRIIIKYYRSIFFKYNFFNLNGSMIDHDLTIGQPNKELKVRHLFRHEGN